MLPAQSIRPASFAWACKMLSKRCHVPFKNRTVAERRAMARRFSAATRILVARDCMAQTLDFVCGKGHS